VHDRAKLGARLGAGLLSALLVASCGEEPREEVIRPVRSMVVGDVAGLGGRSFPGRTKATQEVDLGFEVTGQLEERPADVGDEVESGQLLARLDARDYVNALARATAARDRTKTFRDRVAEAAATGAVSQQDLTDAEARYAQTEAEVAIQQKAVEDTLIVAPFDGVVSQTYVDNFQNVRAKQPVIRLLDVSELEMVIDVPEGMIGLVPYVKDIRIRFDAHPEVEVAAEIKEIGNEASAATRTYPVTLIMDPPTAFDLKPGMAGTATGRADLPKGVEGIEIPLTSVFSPEAEPSQKSFVWVIDSSTSTISRREVEVVELSPRGLVVGGLEPRERIATAGVHYLREGQHVRVIE
jgi:RND family efflux transporter MFP subunit